MKQLYYDVYYCQKEYTSFSPSFNHLHRVPKKIDFLFSRLTLHQRQTICISCTSESLACMLIILIHIWLKYTALWVREAKQTNRPSIIHHWMNTSRFYQNYIISPIFNYLVLRKTIMPSDSNTLSLFSGNCALFLSDIHLTRNGPGF